MLLLFVADSVSAVTYDGFADSRSLSLNGSATIKKTTDGSLLRLTPALEGQSGSAFSRTTVNAAAFSTFFKFRITSPGGEVFDCNKTNGADGIVFVVQSVSSSIGGVGDGIGYAGIENSVGVEFDTWCNEGNNDPSSNHIAIVTGGDVVHGRSLPKANVTPAFDNGKIWYAWVDYNGTTLEARISQNGTRPDTPIVQAKLDIPKLIGNVRNAYVGFTAGTGLDWGKHDILYWEYRENYTPVEVLSGVVNRLQTLEVTCTNSTTGQSVTIPASQNTAWNCEDAGLDGQTNDETVITIKGLLK